MALLLPSPAHTPRKATVALKRLVALIKAIPGTPEARAWLAMEPSPLRSPDFLFVDSQNRAALIATSDLREAEAREVIEPTLLTPPDPSRINALYAAAEGVASFAPDQPTVPRIVMAPSVPAALLGRFRLPTRVIAFGSEHAGREAFAGALGAVLESSPPLTRGAAASLRRRFCPEVCVPSHFRPTLREPATAQGPVPDEGASYLLDFDQEAWIKTDLHPSAEASAAAGDDRARLVTGPAGSGKSLVLLLRAALLARFDRGSRILVITHNKPLAGELVRRFGALAPGPCPQVEIVHFYRWCGLRNASPERTLITASERDEWLGATVRDNRLPIEFYRDEISLIADQVDDSVKAYLALDRTGRGVPLDPAARRRVHALYDSYRAHLRASGLIDWPFIVRAVWVGVERKRIHLPRYDRILVDEGQFFAPLWFALLRRCLAVGTGDLCVAADPAQGFLKRRRSWASAGLDVRGRSVRLARSYRCRPEIRAFAQAFVGRRADGDDGDDEFSLPVIDEPVGYRTPPRLVYHPTPQDAIAWAASHVATSVARGVAPSAHLVLHAESHCLAPLEEALQEACPVCRLDHRNAEADGVGIASLGAATGLERAIVIILGLDRLFEGEADPRLSAEGRAELHAENTKRVYMALTRAGERLLISYHSEATRAELTGHDPASTGPPPE
ncbi:N/A [soil metagenome]